MPETPLLLTEKYGADISELAQNNLYVHGTTKPNLFRTERNNGGIIETGLNNGVSVSEDTLARNMMYSTAVRYGGSGINGVLIFYDPPKGTLLLDQKVFPPSATSTGSYFDQKKLGSEHIAFWLETSKSGIERYVKEALTVMLENTANNEDLIGEFVDGLAQLIAENALVPNIPTSTEFREENVEDTHTKLNIDIATTRACEILWNSLSENLFSQISDLQFYTVTLSKLIGNEEEKQRLFQLLSGQKKEYVSITSTTEFVSNFIKLWKQFKGIQLPYDILQEEIQKRISYFNNQAIELEIWLADILHEVEEYQKKEAKKANSPLTKLRNKIKNSFKPLKKS